MNHDAVRRRLTDYHEDALSPRSRERMDVHLSGCPACREESDGLKRTVALLRGVDDREEPPAYLAAAVMQRLEAGDGRPPWHVALTGWLDNAWAAPLVTGFAGLALLVIVQSVEVEIKWPGAAPSPTPLALNGSAGSGPSVRFAPSGQAAELAQSAQLVGVNSSAAAATREPPGTAAGGAARLAPSAALPLASSDRGPVGTLRTACLHQPSADRCRAWHSWLLGLAVDDPGAFVVEAEAVPIAMRQRWLGDLSRFAARSGSAVRVAQQLRDLRDPRGKVLAPHFERVTIEVPR